MKKKKDSTNYLHYKTRGKIPQLANGQQGIFPLVIANAQKPIWNFLAHAVKCSVHFLIWSFVTCEIKCTGQFIDQVFTIFYKLNIQFLNLFLVFSLMQSIQLCISPIITAFISYYSCSSLPIKKQCGIESWYDFLRSLNKFH